MNKFERMVILATIVIAIAMNSWSLVYQSTRSTEDKLFVGSYPILFDLYTYYTKMSWGADGHWLYENRYTTEPVSSEAPIYMFYVVLGNLARFAHIPIVPFFILARVVFGLFYLAILIYAIRFFIPQNKIRLIAYPIIVFASGFSFLGIGSADWFLYDLIPAARFFYFPHMLLADASLLLCLMLVISGRKKQNYFLIICGGLTGLLLIIVLPFYLFIILPLVQIIFLHEFYNKSRRNLFRDWIVFHLCLVPGALLTISVGLISPIWADVQRYIAHYPDIPTWQRLLGLGILLPAGIGSIIFSKQISPFLKLLMGFWAVWIIVFSEISIIPLSRRTFEAMPTFPYGVLAAYGIYEMISYLLRRQKGEAKQGLISLMPVIISIAVLIFGSNFVQVQAIQYVGSNYSDPRYFLPSDIVQVGEWIDANVSKDTTILSSFAPGNVLPFYARRKVFLGQDPETLDFYPKKETVEKIFNGELPIDQVSSLMNEHHIGVVVLMDKEVAQLATIQAVYPILKEAFRTKNIVVLTR